MKKILLCAFLAVITNTYSQPKMQATIRRGSSANTIDVFLRSSASFSQKDEAMTFALAIPASDVLTSTGSSGVTTNSKGAVNKINGLQPVFLTDNYGATSREVVVSTETLQGKPYYIYTLLFAGTATSSHQWIAGEEQKVFSIGFNGCRSDDCLANMLMVNLPNGGSNKIAYWYFQSNVLGDITNYKEPFYANEESTSPGKGVANGLALVSIGLKTEPFTPNAINVVVYPSITKGMVNVKLPLGSEDAQVKVFNASGTSVMLNESKGMLRQLNLGSFADGTYMIHITDKGKRLANAKVILQK